MKIAIAGYGVEGESNYKYYAADSSNDVTIVDQNKINKSIPHGVSTITGEYAFENLQGFDLVIRTASLAPQKIKTTGKIWSATNEFFSKCPAPIIGVTGSKGKGTTASIITNILRKSEKKVWLVGNIGVPALDVLPKIKAQDFVVYELSSFQLWDLEKSPHIAVVLFIEREHQDVHSSMKEYVSAKANIASSQHANDYLIYNNNNNYAIDISKKSKAKKVGYTDNKTAHIKNDCFYYGEQKICSTNSLKLVGKHNLDNACAAIDAVWSVTNDVKAIKNGLESFKGLDHRLQFVDEIDGIKFYDDSIATTPSSAIAALRSFIGPKIIILGGSSKGSDFSKLADELKEQDVIAILIGDEASRIADACKNVGFLNFEIINKPTMEKVVKKAYAQAKPGDIVLLSPAAASFGLFKNYADRGNQFVSAIHKIKTDLK